VHLCGATTASESGVSDAKLTLHRMSDAKLTPHRMSDAKLTPYRMVDAKLTLHRTPDAHLTPHRRRDERQRSATAARSAFSTAATPSDNGPGRRTRYSVLIGGSWVGRRSTSLPSASSSAIR